jgi:hypothetical protein
MATVLAADSLPRLITKPLAKISHATVTPERPVPEWSHLKERDDLVIVLDRVRVLEAPHYVERRVIRVVCGAELVVSRQGSPITRAYNYAEADYIAI